MICNMVLSSDKCISCMLPIRHAGIHVAESLTDGYVWLFDDHNTTAELTRLNNLTEKAKFLLKKHKNDNAVVIPKKTDISISSIGYKLPRPKYRIQADIIDMSENIYKSILNKKIFYE